jgi:phenylacetate-coenzyme A ligase PaaK-like adenylate-forming protein
MALLAAHALRLIPRILRDRARLRRRERWSREELERHQAGALAELLRFARERSPFYAHLHRGLERAPLAELPVVTKATLMLAFDEVVTDRALTLERVQSHLSALRGDELLDGRYWVAATSGSSGRRTIVPCDVHEWSAVIASYARAQEWSGVRVSPLRHAKMAVVSSRSPFHQSLRVGQSVQSPMIETLRLDAGHPLAQITRALDAFQPEILVAYASMIQLLAEEQLAHRLHIAPRAVSSSSEVFSAEGRARATEAWHAAPFEVYAATETGGIAAECERHTGMHLFEDLVIPEVVDDDYRPVPLGETGSRLLVTVLSSRTMPLVRYELTDRVRLATSTCSCGRPFRLVAAVEGRTDDVIELRGAGGGSVRVHPVVFHEALDGLHVGAWQVRQERDQVRVLLAGTRAAIDHDALAGRIAAGLARAGAAHVPILVEELPELPSAASGKRPLVVALRASEVRS